jgi:hypothetical protein
MCITASSARNIYTYIIGIDEDLGLWIESFAIINIHTLVFSTN